MTKKGPVTVSYASDSHLFSGGFGDDVTLRTVNRLAELFESSDMVVLHGDIFELPFSDVGFSRTVARAISALRVMLTSYPDKEVNYIVGNHDGDPVFVHLLHALAQEYPNFRVTEKHLMLEGRIATHGDLIQKRQKERCTEFKDQFSWGSTVSGLQAQLQTWAEKRDAVIYSPHKWSPNADSYLGSDDADRYKEAKEIITGHTHVPFGEFTLNNKIQRNTGATFDDDSYYPIITKIGASTFDSYKAEAKPKHTISEAHNTGRAQKSFQKIKDHTEKRADRIEGIVNDPHASFQEKMFSVKEAYSKTR